MVTGPTPSPPPIKTIVNTVVRPFCTALKGRVGAAVIVSGQNNAIIVKSYPLLDAYNKALTQGSDTDAYFAARKLDTLNRQFKQNLDAIRALASPDPQATAPPGSRDDKLDDLRRELAAVYQQQQQLQTAIDAFVNATLYDATPEGHMLLEAGVADNTASTAAAARSGIDNTLKTAWLGHASAPVAAIDMGDLPTLLKQDVIQINLAEEKLRPVVQTGVTQCYSKP